MPGGRVGRRVSIRFAARVALCVVTTAGSFTYARSARLLQAAKRLQCFYPLFLTGVLVMTATKAETGANVFGQALDNLRKAAETNLEVQQDLFRQ